MTQLTRYLRYLIVLEKSNKVFDLAAIDILLLDFLAKASDKGEVVNVKDLISLKEIASKVTIHERLKKLSSKKLIVLKR